MIVEKNHWYPGPNRWTAWQQFEDESGFSWVITGGWTREQALRRLARDVEFFHDTVFEWTPDDCADLLDKPVTEA